MIAALEPSGPGNAASKTGACRRWDVRIHDESVLVVRLVRVTTLHPSSRR